jgi:hypothetical protein
MKSEDIRLRLRNYFPTGEWALMFEVLDATGGHASRSCDAVAMNTWPSRGLAIHGIEIKVSRSDWLSELKKPAKAEAIAKFCDYWWLAAPKEIVKFGELPEGWGMIAPNGNSMRVVRQAAKNEHAVPPTRMFVASVLRNAGRIDENELRLKSAAMIEGERAKLQTDIDRQVEWKTQHHKSLQEVVNRFEEQSGLKINNGWPSHNLGSYVKLAMQIEKSGTASIAIFAKTLATKAAEIQAALELFSPTPADGSEGR